MKSNPQNIEPGRPARAGQFILKRRYDIVKALFGGSLGWKNLLDIGCGNAAQTAYFAPDVEFIVAMDMVPLAETEGPTQHERIHFVQSSAMEIPFAANSFDAVMSYEVLEHVPDDLTMMREVRRVLKPGGSFVFSVPNKWWIFETHGANVRGLNWLPWNRLPFVSWLPREIHDSIAKARIYTKQQAVDITNYCGFNVKHSGYITAPLDVLPEGLLRKSLRKSLFKGDTTDSPFLAVNLFVVAEKPKV